MTDVAVAHTGILDSPNAGTTLGRIIAEKFRGERPDALIVFASSKYDYSALLSALDEACHPAVLLGCSSAGEFISETPQTRSACAMGLRAPDMHFKAGLGCNLQQDRKKAAKELVSAFSGLGSQDYAYRAAMVLTDALAGFADSVVEEITLLTAGRYLLFGGGAGDDAMFNRTHVFYGREAFSDAIVALEILSNKPLGIGAQHGWEPASKPMRVTEVAGKRLISLNSALAVDAFKAHAKETGQQFDPRNALPFFLSNVIGIKSAQEYRLRVPLTLNDDGSITCAAEIPVGSTVCLMRATEITSSQAAEAATKSALDQISPHKPKGAIFFDCVATRLRTGQDFGLELSALQDCLLPAQFIGCNTYGQIARTEGQFGGFHNCTAVIGIIPD